MKILIITDNIKGQVNGVATTYKNIERVARDRGHDIVYIDAGNFSHIDCPLYPEVKLSFPWKIGKKIEAMGADRIHIATEGPIGLMAKLFCDFKKIEYTTAYHTKFPEFIHALTKIPTWLTYPYFKWFHKKSKTVLVPTYSVSNELEKIGFGNIKVWTRGVSKDIIKKRTKFDNSHILKVLCVSRVSKEKGLDDLCQLQDKYNITIVGHGPYLNTLARKYKKVNFTGYKFGEALAEEYIKNEVFCFPSKTDTFGVVMIEAMANGLPVAAYPVTGPVDVITSNHNGYMSDDLEYAIEQCRNYDKKKIQKESIENWTWEKATDQFLGE